jgi:hypothetical protein
VKELSESVYAEEEDGDEPRTNSPGAELLAALKKSKCSKYVRKHEIGTTKIAPEI